MTRWTVGLDAVGVLMMQVELFAGVRFALC